MTTTLCDRVEQVLQSRAGQWVDASELMAAGGAFAWRTRVSNLRQRRGLTIENRWRTVEANGRKYRVSEYRLVKEAA